MVYSLLFLAAGRSVNLSLKTWQRSKVLLERKLPVRILPFPQYSSEDKEKSTPKQENIEKKEKKPPTDPKAHINYIIEEAKKGKLPVSEIKTLGQSVLTEAPYKNYSKAPQNVQYISFAGLVPMMGIPLMSLLSGHALPGLVFTHLAFGATVLSFLGGSAWHEAISKNDYSLMKLGWAITPQVIGWISLLLPIPLGILLTSGGFCLSLVHDVLLASYPAWMKSLRLILTGGTLVSYGLMLIFYLILSRRSWSSRSRSRTDSRSRSASSDKKRTHSRSSSSKSHSRSRSTSRDKSKSRKPESSSSSSRSKESPKRLDSPPKVTVPRYYGRNRKDSSSSLSLDSSDTDSKTNFSQPSSSNSNRNNIKKNASDDYSSGCRSAGNARSTSKQTPKERPQEKLKKKMQALLNKQFRADKKAEKERMEKAEQERQDREAELRDIAIKIRRRERYLRHRGEDEENDGEREALRRRERYLRRSEEEEGKRVEKRDGDRWSESSESGKSKSRSPEGKSRRSRSPRRSRRSRSSSPKPSRLAKSSRTLVDY